MYLPRQGGAQQHNQQQCLQRGSATEGSAGRVLESPNMAAFEKAAGGKSTPITMLLVVTMKKERCVSSDEEGALCPQQRQSSLSPAKEQQPAAHDGPTYVVIACCRVAPRQRLLALTNVITPRYRATFSAKTLSWAASALHRLSEVGNVLLAMSGYLLLQKWLCPGVTLSECPLRQHLAVEVCDTAFGSFWSCLKGVSCT